MIEEPLEDRKEALEAQGCDLRIMRPPSSNMGVVCVIVRNDDDTLIGGADPREEAVAQGD